MESRKIKMPKDLSEVTLGQYQAIKAIPEDASEEFAMSKILSTITDIHPSELNRAGIASRTRLLEETYKTLKEEESYPLKTKIPHNGKMLGFVPNLDNITMAEFVDMDKNFTDVNNWHKFIAICYRPITNTIPTQKGSYLIEPYDFDKDRAERCKTITMDVVLGAMFFFIHLGSELASLTLKSGRLTELQRKRKLTSEQSGVGTELSIYLVMEDLKLLPKKWGAIHYMKPSISLHLNQIKID